MRLERRSLCRHLAVPMLACPLETTPTRSAVTHAHTHTHTHTHTHACGESRARHPPQPHINTARTRGAMPTFCTAKTVVARLPGCTSWLRDGLGIRTEATSSVTSTCTSASDPNESSTARQARGTHGCTSEPHPTTTTHQYTHTDTGTGTQAHSQQFSHRMGAQARTHKCGGRTACGQGRRVEVQLERVVTSAGRLGWYQPRRSACSQMPCH